jgi:hypothetical protein
MMTPQNTCRKKPYLSEHQKQIRILTGLSVVICAVLAVVFFWLMTRPSFLPHGY